MYVCVYVCMCACMHVRTYSRTSQRPQRPRQGDQRRYQIKSAVARLRFGARSKSVKVKSRRKRGTGIARIGTRTVRSLCVHVDYGNEVSNTACQKSLKL